MGISRFLSAGALKQIVAQFTDDEVLCSIEPCALIGIAEAWPIMPNVLISSATNTVFIALKTCFTPTILPHIVQYAKVVKRFNSLSHCNAEKNLVAIVPLASQLILTGCRAARPLVRGRKCRQVIH